MYIFKKQNYFDFVSNFPTYWIFPCKLFTKLNKDVNKTWNITRTETGEKTKRLENLTWIQKIIKSLQFDFSITFITFNWIFINVIYTISVSKKKNCKHRKHFIWKKMVKIWWNSCSKYLFSTIWSFILFNQSITYLVLGVNKLKGNKSKQQIYDMNSKNDTCKMY